MRTRDSITDLLDHKHAPKPIKQVRFYRDSDPSDSLVSSTLSDDFLRLPKKTMADYQNKYQIKEPNRNSKSGTSFLKKILLFFTWPLRKIWEICSLPSKNKMLDDLTYVKQLYMERDEEIFLVKQELKEKDTIIKRQEITISKLQNTDIEIEREKHIKVQLKQEQNTKDLLQKNLYLQELLSGSLANNRSTLFYRGHPILDTNPKSELVTYFNPSAGLWKQVPRLHTKKKLISSEISVEKKQESKYENLKAKSSLNKEFYAEKANKTWFQSWFGRSK